MLFPTLQFVLFFVFVYIISILARRRLKLYKYFLILISFAFYYGFGLTFTFYLLLFAIINVLFLNFFQKHLRKRYFIFGIFINLLFLGIFKYYNFFADSIFSFLHSIQIQADLSFIQIIAPIGISFYTFRAIATIFDIYRKKIISIRSLDYLVYLTFFPQITSGPISRPKEFLEDLCFSHTKIIDSKEIILLLMSGILKKLVLSSFLFGITQQTFSTPEAFSSFDLVIGALSYSAMIYTDFSGYSDLANAISLALGFNSVGNFNGPYSASSLQEFWKKWHISLSSWLRDYLYIPLGGNRKGKVRTYINLFLTMLIGGIWHGAGFTFIIWGALHGFGMIVNHAFQEFKQKRRRVYTALIRYENLWKFISIITTFTFVSFAWIFFNSRNMDIATSYLSGIFYNNNSNVIFGDLRIFFVIALIMVINFFGSDFKRIFSKIFDIENKFIRLALLITIFYIILQLGPSEVPPFIYFSF